MKRKAKAKPRVQYVCLNDPPDTAIETIQEHINIFTDICFDTPKAALKWLKDNWGGHRPNYSSMWLVSDGKVMWCLGDQYEKEKQEAQG